MNQGSNIPGAEGYPFSKQRVDWRNREPHSQGGVQVTPQSGCVMFCNWSSLH
ncbi:hypothetical protein ABIG06_000344 [Bradyrhizobium sp. USDA 326]